jgi:hypothetical protein
MAGVCAHFGRIVWNLNRALRFLTMNLNGKLFELPKSEIEAYGIDNLTYGSLSLKGASALCKVLQNYIQADKIVGFDLGCGDGELMHHFQQLLPESVWDGVEISEHRVSVATRDVHIWQGNMLDESYHVYNVLHCDNLCLDVCIEERLEAKIAHEFNGIFISYRPLESELLIRNSYLLHRMDVESSWGVPAHILFYKV